MQDIITPEMLRGIEKMEDGIIVRHIVGSQHDRDSLELMYEARPDHRRPLEESWTDYLDATADDRIVVRAADMFNGHDLEGLTDDERYELLADALMESERDWWGRR